MPDDTPEERKVTQRANYLARATDLRDTEAEAIAWTERGYSWTAVSRKLDTGESTAQSWIECAMAQYGLEIAETRHPEELEPPLNEPTYDRVDSEYFETRNRADIERWVECVDRHADRLPDDWATEILNEAWDRGFYSAE